MVIDCRRDAHWGFLSLINILLDCCSHMWPNYFVWAKGRPPPFGYTHVCVCTPTHTAHVHVCMANAGVGVHAETDIVSHAQTVNADSQDEAAHTSHMCCMKASRLGRSQHLDPFTHPSMEAHTILPLDSDWFSVFLLFFCFFYNPFSASHQLTESPLFILLQGESNHVRAQRTCDWLALSPCDYLHFIQSGRCASTKSSACYSHFSPSHPLQTSHTLLARICTDELHFVVSVSILPPLTGVRFHISSHFSVLDSTWYFKGEY